MLLRKIMLKRNHILLFVSFTLIGYLIIRSYLRQHPLADAHWNFFNSFTSFGRNSEEPLRDFTKQSKLNLKTVNVTEEKSLCSLNLPDLFIANDEYEGLFLPQDEIYSTSFVTETQKVQAVIPDTVVRLRPDKFLFPMLIRGPNNQLIGLRESIYVAIRLNRTLVIPRFYKHRTDSQIAKSSTIHPGHRVDLLTLCSFVSCITSHQFRTACGNKADVVMRLRRYSMKKISNMESFNGLRFSKTRDQEHKIINFKPEKEEKSKPGGEIYFKSSEEEIRGLFGSEERCAIYGQPFYNLKIRPKSSRHRIQPNSDLKTYNDNHIFSEIIRHTPAPRYIVEIAKNFIEAVIAENKFLAVHWRYDNKDWMKRCNEQRGSDDRMKRCEDILKITPSDVAQAIVDKVKSTVFTISAIYIAAPPSEKDFVEAIKRILDKENLTTNHLGELSKFIDERYGECNFYRKHEQDIHSTVEMQICARSSIFMRSSRSSWSSNVIEWRRNSLSLGTLPREDEDIFVSANNIVNTRIKSGQE